MSFLVKRIPNIFLLSFLFIEVFLVTACDTKSISSQPLQFIFSPPSGTTFSTDSVVSATVFDHSPICTDVSDGQGVVFEDTRVDKCIMTVNGMDSGASYENEFLCNETQTQGAPLGPFALQTFVCYGGIPTFTVTVICTQGTNVVGESTATYNCVY